MARVIFLTQVLPYPLDSGAKIRAYYVLRQLVQQHQVTLVSFTRADDRAEHLAHLIDLCHAVHTVPMRRSRLLNARALLIGAVTRQPIIIVRDQLSEMFALLDRLIVEQAIDIVHADQTSMAQYALYVQSQTAKIKTRHPVRLLLDAHNALYRIPERLAAHERNPFKRFFLHNEARALKRYEANLWQQFDHVVCVAEQDRWALQNQQLTGLNFTIIPICVDPAVQPLVSRVSRPCAITHIGTMFWPPNAEGVLWFAREVFPHVLTRIPEATFVIVGKNPPEEIRALTAKNHKIKVIGYAPHLEPYLAETAAFVVPLRAGGGMRVKITDAWCWGVPIVSTSIGAEGIDLQHGTHALIADTPEALTAATVRLLQDPGLGAELSASGRRWVEERYNWRQVYGKWNDVYSRLCT